MSKCSWITGIAFGLAFALLPPQNAGAQQQGQSAQEQIAVPPPAFGLIEQSQEPDQLTNPCEPGEDNRNSDLCAQWKAADAANQSAGWAGPTFWLGIVGAGIGVFTLVAAVGAAIFAKSAANATWKTVEVTREIGEAQTRAYLSISKASFISRTDRFDALLFVKNSAPTPAKKVSIRCELMTYEGPTHDSETMRGIVQHDTSISQEVPAADIEKMVAVWHYGKLQKLSRDRLHRIYPMCNVLIDIEWLDIFNKKQTVRYLANATEGHFIRGDEPDITGDFIVQRVFTLDGAVS